MTTTLFALALSLLMSIVSQANVTPLANTSDGNVIGDIGYVTTGTHGQVFVAPCHAPLTALPLT